MFFQLKKFDIHLVHDRDSGSFKGFAYVTFENEQQMNTAISGLNGADFGNRVLKVNRAQQRDRSDRGGGRGGISVIILFFSAHFNNNFAQDAEETSEIAEDVVVEQEASGVAVKVAASTKESVVADLAAEDIAVDTDNVARAKNNTKPRKLQIHQLRQQNVHVST